MLKMKSKCESCSEALSMSGPAYICSYECTYCETCSDDMSYICPNCDGELLKRPTRKKGLLEVAGSQIKNKLFGK